MCVCVRVFCVLPRFSFVFFFRSAVGVHAFPFAVYDARASVAVVVWMM